MRNGMFMGTARKLCPNLVSIAYDFDGYSEVSRTLYDTVARYSYAPLSEKTVPIYIRTQYSSVIQDNQDKACEMVQRPPNSTQ